MNADILDIITPDAFVFVTASYNDLIVTLHVPVYYTIGEIRDVAQFAEQLTLRLLFKLSEV